MSSRASRAPRARAAAQAAPATRPAPAKRPRPAAKPAERSRPARARRAPAARRRPRASSSSRLFLIGIPIVVLLLAGIVWVNVAKLGLTTQTGAVVERSRALEAETLRLETRLERRDATVVDRARVELGMVPSAGESVTYLDATP